MKDKLTLEEAVSILNDKLVEKANGLNHVISAATKLSKDSVFNLAAFLKFNYGPCLENMGDSDWKCEAKAILKFVRSK